MSRLVLGLLLGAAGCGEARTNLPMGILDASSLVPVSLSDDPFADHRPTEVNCPPGAWGPEGGGFEIQTGACAYAAFDQVLPEGLREGDTLEVVLWHDFLDAAELATGHVAVWVGDVVVWQREVGIPSPSATLVGEAVLPFTPPPGTRLGLHLHNHGFNSWRLVSIDAY